MRILAIAFGLSLVGCVDQVTPLGIDDINENTDQGTSPDVPKDDVDPQGRPSPGTTTKKNVCTGCTIVQGERPLAPEAELNVVPRR